MMIENPSNERGRSLSPSHTNPMQTGILSPPNNKESIIKDENMHPSPVSRQNVLGSQSEDNGDFDDSDLANFAVDNYAIQGGGEISFQSAEPTFEAEDSMLIDFGTKDTKVVQEDLQIQAEAQRVYQPIDFLKQLSDAQVAVDILNKKLGFKDTTIEELSKKIKLGYDQFLLKEERTKQIFQRKINSLETDNSVLRTHVESLKKSIALEKLKRFCKNKASEKTLEEEKSKANSKIFQYQMQIRDLETELATSQKETSSFKDHLKANQFQTDDLKSKYSGLRSLLAEKLIDDKTIDQLSDWSLVEKVLKQKKDLESQETIEVRRINAEIKRKYEELQNQLRRQQEELDEQILHNIRLEEAKKQSDTSLALLNDSHSEVIRNSEKQLQELRLKTEKQAQETQKIKNESNLFKIVSVIMVFLSIIFSQFIQK